MDTHRRALVLLPAAFTLAFAWACNSGDKAKSEAIDLSCETDTEVLQPSGNYTGFYLCNERFSHRVEAATCDVPEAPETCEPTAQGAPSSCTTSAECTDRPHGACLDDGIVNPSASQGCRCVYSCETDTDCDGDSVCDCRGERPRCTGGECATDDDCEGLCVVNAWSGACGGGGSSLVCLDPDDECLPGLPETCPEIPDCNGGMSPAPCEHTSNGWTCGEFECGTSCG